MSTGQAGSRGVPHHTLAIVGCGGFGREVAWLASEALGSQASLLFAVDGMDPGEDSVDGIPVLRLEALAAVERPVSAVIAISDGPVRQRIAGRLDGLGIAAATLVHPGVAMSRSVELGGGSIVCAGSIMTTNIRVGRHVHVNLACTIGHDAVLEDFCTLAPGVHVSGNVHVGEGAFIGTGASIINGSRGRPLRIGPGAVVAAGACVTKDVEDGAMVAGVPATRRR